MNKFLPIILFFVLCCSQKNQETIQQEWTQLGLRVGEFIDRDKYDSALTIANKRLKIAQSSANAQWKSDAYNDLGLLLMYYGQFEKSEDHYRTSLSFIEDAVTYHNLALVQNRQGNYEEAYKSATKSYELYLSDSTIEQRTLFNSKLAMASILNSQLKFEEATKLVEETIEFSQQEKDSTLMMEAVDMLATICVYSEQNELAYPLYRKLISYYDRQNLPIQMAEGYNDLGSVFHQDGKYDSAINFYERSMKLKLQHTQDSSIVRINLRNIANAYGRLNQPEKEQEVRNIIARIESKIR